MPELPKWKAHEIVEADKIVSVSCPSSLPAQLLWHLQCGVTIPDSLEFANQVSPGYPPVGGYYIRHTDGSESWKSAKDFEQNYTRIFPSYRDRLAEAAVNLAKEMGKLPDNEQEWAKEYFIRDPNRFIDYMSKCK